MEDVIRELNTEETADLARGTVPAHSASASNFLVNGLQLEELQYRLLLLRCPTPPYLSYCRWGVEIREGNTKRNHTLQALAVDDKEAELCCKISNWKGNLQHIFMPGLQHSWETAERDVNMDTNVNADCEV